MTLTENHRHIRDSVRYLLNNHSSKKILFFKLFVSIIGSIFGIAYTTYEWHNGHLRLMIWLIFFMLAKDIDVIMYWYKHKHNMNDENYVLFNAIRTVVFFFSFVWYVLGCVLYLGVHVYEKEVPFSYYLLLTLIILDTLMLTIFITAKILLYFYVKGLMQLLPYVMDRSEQELDSGLLLRSSLFDPMAGITQPYGNACPICKNLYGIKYPSQTLACGHKFHMNCLDSWLHMTGVCPICHLTVEIRI